MAYQSLYRKYRPSTMDEVVGQQHIVEVLTNSVKKDKISHAYLLTGPRGTGKTSTAKLFARAVNCTSETELICGQCDNCVAVQNNTHPDLIEIDAASNNGVDEIRSLIERVKYTPILGKYKVYIIDEVHMLTQGAFNALLKTLEEPPSHVVFILATTEIHKVLPTIISRCQRFDFTRIPELAIAERLDSILDQEHESAEPGATELIASLSGGGLRNALTILEQAIVLSDGPITKQQIYASNGVLSVDGKMEMFRNIAASDMQQLIDNIQGMKMQSVSYDRLVMDITKNLKDSLIYTYTKMNTITEDTLVHYLSEAFTTDVRLKMIDILLEYAEKMRFSQQPEMYFEIAMLDIFNHFSNKSDRVQGQQTQKVTQFVTNKQETVVETPKDLKPIVESVNSKVATDLDPVVLTKDVNKQPEVVISNPEDAIQFEFDDTEDEIIEDVVDDSANSSNIAPVHTENSIGLKNIDTDMVIRLMVTADKSLRLADEEQFTQIQRYRNIPQWARSARLLSGGKVVLSSPFFVVVAMQSEIEVREIGEARNRHELNKFSEVIFNKDKTILAISVNMYQEAVAKFIELNKAGTLPSPVLPEEFTVTEDNAEDARIVDESLDSVLNLFGDSVEIIE